MKFFHSFILKYSIIFTCMFIPFIVHAAPVPRLTVVFVIDQFSYEYIRNLRPFLRCGLGRLLNKGVVYTQAHYPHVPTQTAVGHAGLATGSYPKDHGIVGNEWLDAEGEVVKVNSAQYVMADTISDQFALQSRPCGTNMVFALSLKSRAAIPLANKVGKAIWFDSQHGQFTSSSAYFDTLPSWVKDFNARQRGALQTSVYWRSVYHPKSVAYHFKDTHQYKVSETKKCIVGTNIPCRNGGKEPYRQLEKTPYANQMLLDLARACVEQTIACNCNDRLLLWISLSSLDYVGHDFGPQSFEAIDMIYHIDRQIGRFMRSLRSVVSAGETLYVVTGDHGVSPIPEILEHEGLKNSERLSFENIIENMNTLINEKFEVDGLVTAFKPPYFYLNHAAFDELSAKKQDAALQMLKQFLLKQPCIANAWTYQELAHLPAEPGSLESFFKNSLYHGRSGDLIVNCIPYAVPTEHDCGACHDMPYNYNTHVPIILYQKRTIEREIFYERVYTLQLANTLAYILDVPQPSASLFNMLPGIVVQGCD